MTDELVAELEKAEKGSRKLSDSVLLACGWRQGKTGEGDSLLPDRFILIGPDGKQYLKSRAPDPSRNLQDALDYVVPEGWWVLNSGRETGHALMILQSLPDGTYGKTPPLAACVAALRAKRLDLRMKPSQNS